MRIKIFLLAGSLALLSGTTVNTQAAYIEGGFARAVDDLGRNLREHEGKKLGHTIEKHIKKPIGGYEKDAELIEKLKIK